MHLTCSQWSFISGSKFSDFIYLFIFLLLLWTINPRPIPSSYLLANFGSRIEDFQAVNVYVSQMYYILVQILSVDAQ